MDDLEIDLKQVVDKVKNFFKSVSTNLKMQNDDAEKNNNEELGIDLSSVFSFVKKHSTLFVLLLIILLQFVPNYGFLPWGGVYMRGLVEDLPRLESIARENVDLNLRNQLQDKINKEYPHLSEESKKKAVDDSLKTYYQKNSEGIYHQIELVTNFLKSHYRYEYEGKEYTYMPDIDPYTYLRRARNVIELGRTGDEVKNGQQWDNHMQAPIGMPVETAIHPYFLAYIYKIVSIFKPNIPLMQSSAYFPILMTLLSLIPVFFIAKRLTGNNIGGIVSATILAVHPYFLSRTPWGHADNDAYNILLPLIIVWLFVEIFKMQKLLNKILMSLGLGFVLGVYSYIWAWWYLFDFMLFAMFAHLTYLVFKEFYAKKEFFNEKIKNNIKTCLILVIASSLILSLFIGVGDVIKAPILPFGFTTLRDASLENLWPNVYTTVAELNPYSVEQSINNFGKILFYISLLGIILIFLRKEDENKIVIPFLAAWLIATLYATTKGARFTLLIMPAASILYGATAGLTYKIFYEYAEKSFNLSNKLSKILSLIVILFLFGFMLKSSVQNSFISSISDLPIMNDAWWNSLTAIKEGSNKTAIINSWWDFGHHFKYIADRPVTFDGASQNAPMAHWIGKALLTNDEKETIGILRMLDCGSTNAYDILFKENNDTVKSINALYKILTLDKESARKVLESYTENPEEILKYTHCNPPENFFITSDDMIGKAGVWGHFGSWNFERARIWMMLRKLPKAEAVNEMIKDFNYKKEDAEKIYDEVSAISSEEAGNLWVTQWPGFLSGAGGCAKDANNAEILLCKNSAVLGGQELQILTVLNLTNSDSEIEITSRDGKSTVLKPSKVAFINNEKQFVSKSYKTELSFGVIIIPTETGALNVLAATDTVDSLFTRLYFFEGHGLKYFKPFTANKQLLGGWIRVWKIDWEGKQENTLPTLFEKDFVDENSIVVFNYAIADKSGKVLESTSNDKNASLNDNFAKSSNPIMINLKENKEAVKKGFLRHLIGMKKGKEKIFDITTEDLEGVGLIGVLKANETLKSKVQIVKIK